jgi:phage shock protein PspC (stress-responsive transcriptional regulator)
MRKVTTINLNNNAYQIDEDGYDALRAYLDKAARALANNPDREEILSDLEQAIADKCLLTLGPHKTVVSTAEIERLLKEMGPVAGGADDTSGNTSDTGQPAGAAADAAPGPGYPPRRLYRIREGQKWAGICTGLAAFAGVDVTLVRIAVVLITIFTGFFPGFFIYILMCFLIPVAATPEEVAAAHGQPFRAQEVVDRVKKKHDDWRNERRGKRRMRQSAFWSAQTVPTPPPGYAARVTGGILLPLLTVLSAVWFAAGATVPTWSGTAGTGWDSTAGRRAHGMATATFRAGWPWSPSSRSTHCWPFPLALPGARRCTTRTAAGCMAGQTPGRDYCGWRWWP